MTLAHPLDRLLGTWAFTMRHVALDDEVTGSQRYERVLDGAFVLQHWHYDHPEFPDALGVLSDDEYHYFDVRGITRRFDLSVEETRWTIVRLDADFGQRTTTTFVGDDATEAAGELSHDHGRTWVHDFTATARRA